MDRTSEAEVKERFQFVSGIRFEMFYSLAALLGPGQGALEGWRAQAAARVSHGLRDQLAHFGNAPHFWILMADALGSAWPGNNVEDLLATLHALEPEELVRRILVGAIHDSDLADRVVAGRLDLDGAIRKLPPRKREWLEHIGLYPPRGDAGTLRAVSALVEDPAGSREVLGDALAGYHRDVFAATWSELAPRLDESLAAKRRLFEATSLEEFFRLALLRVEVDSTRGLLRAIRGGYELPYVQLKAAYVVPSAFNRGRYWTAFPDDGGVVAFLPYFDPDIAVGPMRPGAVATDVDPGIDVALVAKALGDATRFAIATLVAKTPMSSAQIADELKLSRPTVSHHVVLLREASLLNEESRGGSVFLSLRRDTLASLSAAAVQRFFGERA